MNTHTLPSIRIREDLLNRANEAYHNGTPTIPDIEYDQLWLDHLATRAANPQQFPTNTILDKVGAAPTKASGFQKVKHSVPMLSLDNVFEDEEDGCQGLNDWLAGIAAIEGKAQIIVEPKIDGLSLRLTYNHAGKLICAATRGNGNEGDDATLNVIASGLSPVSIKRQVNMEVNGEVFMDYATFRRLNEEQILKGEEPYANPRNAAAGALRLIDPAECAKRGLRFIAHGVVGDKFDEHSLAMLFLALNLFEVPSEFSMKADTVVESVSALRRLVASNLGYPIDGLVFKLDDRKFCNNLGSTSRAPRWAIALKFQQEKVVTKLEGITVQVGRSGILAPVGELRPVWVDGSTVSRVTLHNEDHIRRLGLLIGDDVEIIKSGAVIPQLVSSVSAVDHRANFERFYAAKYPDDTPEALRLTVDQNMTVDRPPFDLLAHIDGRCPSCGGEDIRKAALAGGHSDHEDTLAVAYRCMNPGCLAQLAGRIQHFCSRSALDIEGVGEEMSGALAEAMGQMNLSHPIDLLDWSVGDLMVMSWTTASGGTMTFGESRAKKAYASLERSRALPLHRWLFALGIPSIGENTSKEISRLCEEVSELRYACRPKKSPQNINGGMIYRIAQGENKSADALALAKFGISSHLGPVSCRAMVAFYSSEEGESILGMLDDWGIKSDNYSPIPVKVETGSMLGGKCFVVTGTLSAPRSQIEELITAAGGKNVGSISKKTDFLVAGDNCGSKLDKAKAVGVAIISETELRNML